MRFIDLVSSQQAAGTYPTTPGQCPGSVGLSTASVESDALVGDGHIDSPGQSLGGSELHWRSTEDLGVADVAVVRSDSPGSRGRSMRYEEPGPTLS